MKQTTQNACSTRTTDPLSSAMLRCVLQSWTVLPSQKRLSPSKRLLPHRRTQLGFIEIKKAFLTFLGRLNSYSLDDLFEQLKKELGHDNLLDQDLLEESGTETKRPKFDFANQQQLWPSGQDGSGFVTIGPRNYVHPFFLSILKDI